MNKFWVQRDENGKVIGLYALRQVGYAEEQLPEDHPDVVAFSNAANEVVSVSARQFKLQLYAAGLTGTVEGWIAAQSPEVKIAYDNSGSFEKYSPVMQAGFAALGFTDEEITAFFDAASQL